MSLLLEIEFLSGVCFAALGPDSPMPDWPPQPDRIFSALVATWAARGEKKDEEQALHWLEAQPAPSLLASGMEPRTAPPVYVPPNDYETPTGELNKLRWYREFLSKNVSPPEKGGHKKLWLQAWNVMPDQRKRSGLKERNFPATRPHDPVVRLYWQGAKPGEAIFSALEALARDTAYVGHSASLTRCRFLLDQSPQRWVYAGRLAELRRTFDAGRRPLSGARVAPISGAKQERTNLFGERWLLLEHVAGEMPDLRACALVAKTLRDALLSGYQRIGLGKEIPEVISGHAPDGTPTRAPHLAVVPLPFTGFPYADGHVMGFALVPPKDSAILEDETFRKVLRSLAPIDKDYGRRILTLTTKDGTPSDRAFSIGLSPTFESPAGKRSLDPALYTRTAQLFATVTPVVLDRHLKEKGAARDEEIATQIASACRNVGLPKPETVVGDKHSAIEGGAVVLSFGQIGPMDALAPATIACQPSAHPRGDPFRSARRRPRDPWCGTLHGAWALSPSRPGWAMMLSTKDFAAFFEEVHGCEPFPWQKRLLQQVAEKGEWPSVLDLPTGSGKTAALDIAIFHLALEADRGETRRAPVRIAFVVDRRLVVDDAFTRAQNLENALVAPQGPITRSVADCLKNLSGDGPALIARRLRGGIPREDDWARTPSQPTVLCSTVDQVGSRLLFRGYGVSDSMKPVHAGLIGSDCLILLDEAHLAEPFRQTLDWVRMYRGPNWREMNFAAPWGVALLTATPGEKPQDVFSLDDEDKAHPVLKKRLNASKPARLVPGVKRKAKTEDADEADDGEKETQDEGRDLAHRAAALTEEVQLAIGHFTKTENGVPTPAIGVVVNRVARARAVFDLLRKQEEADCLLLIGPARPVERDELATRLAPIRTGAERALDKPLLLVATQCIEAGVDIDLDALITEAAPLDALRQRFGRLNRAGRDIKPYAAILAAKPDISARTDDPVYGNTIKTAWDRLTKAARKKEKDQIVEFGFKGFAIAMDREALSPKEDAPILLPAHLDLLSQTSPIPAADPDVALYLHGPTRQPDSISVIWRADIEPERTDAEYMRRLLTLVPPRSAEAIELPLWVVRRWLGGKQKSAADIADISGRESEHEEDGRERRRVFRWRGNDESSRWIDPAELRPGDTVIVPAIYGGVDEFGWHPGCEETAKDVGRKAAEPFAGRRFAVRVAPGLLDGFVSADALADALAKAESGAWQDVRASVIALDLPERLCEDLAALDDAKRKAGVTAYLDLYGTDDGRPRGVVFVAPFGIKNWQEKEDGCPNATEDDASGSLPGFRLTLAEHSQDVERKAESFANAAGLPAERIADLKLAGFLHDSGKADPRFQAWLYYSDPLGPAPDDAKTILAKSGRSLPRAAARTGSGLPDNWRHEAFSVRLAPYVARFAEANDPELVLWLIGSHHGHGRPFFPHHDAADGKPRNLPCVLGLPSELPPGPGPQSLAFDWKGLDWPMLFARLKARYGIWELARMEAILRLADHRASEERAREISE